MQTGDYKKCAVILQPGYIPWLGFFEQMFRSDIFVFFDDVKYTKQDWRNRNRLKHSRGVSWLTIPIQARGLAGKKINETEIDNTHPWQLDHLNVMENNYRNSKYLQIYFEELKQFYVKKYSYLSPFVVEFTLWINEKLGLTRRTLMSSSLNIERDSKQGRLIDMLKSLDSDFFYEGSAGKNFIDTELFSRNGITVEFQNYKHPFYNQMWQKEIGYVSHLSILDLLFNHGPDSLEILTGKIEIQNNDGIVVRHADEFRSNR